MKKFPFLLVTTIALIGTLTTACSSTPASNPASPVPSATAASSTPTAAPTISIKSPSSGNKIGIGSVEVDVQVSGLILTNKIGLANAAGEGHIVYYMDVDPPTTAGATAITDPGTYAATTSAVYTWSNVNSGSHKFAVQLVNNDDTPLNPPATDSISLLVIPEIGPPLAVIVSPRTNSVVSGNSVTVTAQATNFNLADKIGQTNATREGHFIYYMDVEPPTSSGKPATSSGSSYAITANSSYTWQNVAAGPHTFAIQLVNNDNTPLGPSIVASVVSHKQPYI